MDITIASGTEEQAEIDAWIARHPEGSLWQSPEWAEYQRALGKEVRFFVARDKSGIVGTALCIKSMARGGIADWQVPRGPLFAAHLAPAERAAVLRSLTDYARADRAVALYLSPPHPLPDASFPGASPSRRHEQPDATIVVDLPPDDERLLGQMKPKGRYNIRLAQRHGVTVEHSRDSGLFAALSRETAVRDGFSAPPERQYDIFLQSIPGSFLLLAYKAASKDDNDSTHPIAGLIGTLWGKTGIYYYGASASSHRELMAPYLLQWEAMRHCRSAGATHYDLLGIAPPDADSGHPWAGVTDFKRKFGGVIVTYPPEIQVILRPLAHAMVRLKRRLLRSV